MERKNARLDITGFKVEKAGDQYRYVNHTKRIATAGFKLRKALVKYSDSFLGTTSALQVAMKRYELLFGKEKDETHK